MKRGLSLRWALACSLGLHLAPPVLWLAVAWAMPPPSKPPKLVTFDDIGIVALREREERVSEPEPPPLPVPPPEPEPPPPEPEPEPPEPEPEPPPPEPPLRPKPAAVPLPVAAPAPPRRAPPPALPPPRANPEEESRVAQRVLDKEALEQAIKDQYRKTLKQTVERNLRYPLAARLAGETGKPSVRFSLATDGSIHSIVIGRSSGHPGLDDAALDAVRRSAPFPPSPFGGEREIVISLNFEKETETEKKTRESNGEP
jgi:protein TonB